MSEKLAELEYASITRFAGPATGASRVMFQIDDSEGRFVQLTPEQLSMFAGAASAATVDSHETNAQQFVKEVDALLLDALALSPSSSPEIFARRNTLRDKLRELLRDNTWVAEKRGGDRIKARVIEFCR